MRNSRLSTAVLLAVLTSGTVFAAWVVSVRYTPPPQPGVIYTVINYARSGGRAQMTQVSVIWGSTRRDIVVPAPYRGTCATTTPSGFVLKLRHTTADSIPLTVATTGSLVRGPYQGEAPIELTNACYKIAS